MQKKIDLDIVIIGFIQCFYVAVDIVHYLQKSLLIIEASRRFLYAYDKLILTTPSSPCLERMDQSMGAYDFHVHRLFPK